VVLAVGGFAVSPDSPARSDVLSLIDEHLTDMYATSPPESVHALDHTALLAPSITFLTARDADGTILGCGALKELTPRHGELKSMRTSVPARGRGVATAVLRALLALADERGYTRVSLDTGCQDYFAAARRLYARHGFTECGPYGDHSPDPNSVFMTRWSA